MSQSPSSTSDISSRPLSVLPQRGFGQTSRKGAWWLAPLLTFLGLGAFVVYSTWAAFQGNYYHTDPHLGPYLLSPFYSPEIFGDHGWFGNVPAWLPVSPALLILWAPGGFRFTCYYYRGAYYKAFWADPVSCAVGEPRKSYWGENSLPLILQNVHRYFLYLALVFLIFLAMDVWHALWFVDTAGKTHIAIGVGTLLLALNVCLLSGYTLGCHSFRHLIGGWRDEVSKSPLSFKCYSCANFLNRKHMLWAWCSLFCVGFCDVYVRLCSMGIWHDLHWSIT